MSPFCTRILERLFLSDEDTAFASTAGNTSRAPICIRFGSAIHGFAAASSGHRLPLPRFSCATFHRESPRFTLSVFSETTGPAGTIGVDSDGRTAAAGAEGCPGSIVRGDAANDGRIRGARGDLPCALRCNVGRMSPKKSLPSESGAADVFASPRISFRTRGSLAGGATCIGILAKGSRRITCELLPGPSDGATGPRNSGRPGNTGEASAGSAGGRWNGPGAFGFSASSSFFLRYCCATSPSELPCFPVLASNPGAFSFGAQLFFFAHSFLFASMRASSSGVKILARERSSFV